MSIKSMSPAVMFLALAAVAGLGLAGRAAVPQVYAITGARIVTVAGPVIDNGNVVVRDGFIEAVGAGAAVPPGAVVIDATGMTVYPGLIDMGASVALDAQAGPPPANARTRAELERWKRQSILHPQLMAADILRADAPELKRLASAGITSYLAVPPGDVVRGQSALLNVALPEEAPQIGDIVDNRRGRYVVKSPVALHVAFPSRPSGTGYPESLFGVIAFVRQSLLDAQHYQAERAHYERSKPGGARPIHDHALEALQPAVSGTMPVVLEASSALEIRRALALAREFGFEPVISGSHEAPAVASDLKASHARVIFSLNFPVRPRTLAPDADEPLRVLQARADTPKAPALLATAGVAFAFSSGGLREPADFVRNAAKAVKSGLSPDEAIKALTLNAAEIAGVAQRLGSIEKGKIANLLVTEGDLFDEKSRVVQVLVDGRPIDIEPPAARPAERRGNR